MDFDSILASHFSYFRCVRPCCFEVVFGWLFQRLIFIFRNGFRLIFHEFQKIFGLRSADNPVYADRTALADSTAYAENTAYADNVILRSADYSAHADHTAQADSTAYADNAAYLRSADRKALAKVALF